MRSNTQSKLQHREKGITQSGQGEEQSPLVQSGKEEIWSGRKKRGISWSDRRKKEGMFGSARSNTQSEFQTRQEGRSGQPEVWLEKKGKKDTDKTIIHCY